MNPALLLLASRAVTVASMSGALGSLLPGGADSLPSPAPGRCEAGPTSVLVGYEPGAPLTEAGNDSRALRVLRSAFPPPCFNLVLRSFRREDLAPTVVAGRLDVGVIGIASAATYAAHGTTSLPAQETENVDTLMLHPASYSVVSIKAAPSHATPARRPWLLLTGGALSGVALLTSCAYLLNFKLPRPRRWFEQARKQLDPRLTGLRGALGWVFGSASGRLLALLWGALGATLSFQHLSARALTDEAEPKQQDYLGGAEMAAYPGRNIYEFRNRGWKKCLRPFQCLRNYDRGDTLALAGDRDVLCHFAAETGAAALEFRSDIAVPMLYALLLPTQAASEATGAFPSAKTAILRALQREPYSGSPWRACEPSLTTARNEP